MSRSRVVVATVVVGSLLTIAPRATEPERRPPTIAQYIKPGLPIELVSARKADRIAWIAYEEGKRNVFVASAPAFKPVRVTSFLKDDGTDLTQVRISDDGSVVAFVRGSAPNSQGWVANPTSDPEGAERAIWAARVGVPASARRLAEGSSPELSPDGRSVLYVNDGQIYRASVSAAAPQTKIEKGEKPFITAWGRNSAPKWSPDGTKIAFSSNRNDHSFIGVYDVKTRSVMFMDPGVDRDTSPTWSPDSKHIAFLRRPGASFGQTALTNAANSGLQPTGVGRTGGGGARGGRQGGAVQSTTPVVTTTPVLTTTPVQSTTPVQTTTPIQSTTQLPPGTFQGGRGGRGGGEIAPPPGTPLANEPGMYRSAFPGGYTLSIWIADANTGSAREVWHTTPEERVFTGINAIQWAANEVIFQMVPPNDEFERYFSINISGTTSSTTAPIMLTTTEGLIEDATAVALSKDGRTLYYCTNAQDIDRRHIFAVPTSGGTPKQVTTGDGIENVPVTLASGKQIAVLSSDAKRPLSIGVWTLGGAQHVIYPTLGPDFPITEEVAPTNVTLKADDGVEFHNQLFLPKDLKAGEKRPALIFVHGGPARQMLLGYHYLSFYHVFYAVNQWLTSQGYIVMSVNYRSGIGYGRSFRTAPNTGARGNAEYKDVLAAGKYLAARPDVDPDRVGIWGLSYGGLLTAEALARNSDIFKAGVDLAGVHLEGNSLDPDTVSFQASAISEINKWKSPVLLVHGDDDRNVNFSQTVGLVQLLRARNIPYELIVFPDDVHETLLHRRWIYTFGRMDEFLRKYLRGN